MTVIYEIYRVSSLVAMADLRKIVNTRHEKPTGMADVYDWADRFGLKRNYFVGPGLLFDKLCDSSDKLRHDRFSAYGHWADLTLSVYTVKDELFFATDTCEVYFPALTGLIEYYVVTEETI